MTTHSTVATDPHPNQGTFLDLSGQEVNPYWIDPNQPLFVPANPLHFEAHELQMLMQMLKKQASTKPGQFSAKNYIDVLEKFTAICKQINNGGSAAEDDDEEKRLDQGDVVASGIEEGPPAMGATTTPGLGPRISTDNPLAG